jgi:soluble lytic murein transglycosylase-like protein
LDYNKYVLRSKVILTALPATPDEIPGHAPKRRKAFAVPKGKKQLIIMARLAAIRHGLNVSLFLAQIRQESGFNPNARSCVGALGIAQIMPATARSWGVNPHNPYEALNGAAKAMAGYYKTYRNQGYTHSASYRMALAAYNAGPGAVHRYKGVPPYRETQRYVKNIMAAAE